VSPIVTLVASQTRPLLFVPPMRVAGATPQLICTKGRPGQPRVLSNHHGDGSQSSPGSLAPLHRWPGLASVGGLRRDCERIQVRPLKISQRCCASSPLLPSAALGCHSLERPYRSMYPQPSAFGDRQFSCRPTGCQKFPSLIGRGQGRVCPPTTCERYSLTRRLISAIATCTG
jgi:hypothetical protein